MKVEIKDANKKFEIGLGDIFYSTRGDDFYILMKNSENGLIELKAFDGEGRWNKYISMAEAEENIDKSIKEERLIHFSKSKYKLVLEEI